MQILTYIKTYTIPYSGISFIHNRYSNLVFYFVVTVISFFENMFDRYLTKKMKKLMFLIAAITILQFVSCDIREACEKQNYGSIKVDSYLFSDYDIYINSAYKGSVDGFGDIAFDHIKAGTYATEYIRISGSDGPPIYTLSIYVSPCEAFTVRLEE